VERATPGLQSLCKGGDYRYRTCSTLFVRNALNIDFIQMMANIRVFLATFYIRCEGKGEKQQIARREQFIGNKSITNSQFLSCTRDFFTVAGVVCSTGGLGVLVKSSTSRQ